MGRDHNGQRLCIIWIFLNLWTPVLWPKIMIYLGKCSMYTDNPFCGILLFLGRVFYDCQVKLVDNVVQNIVGFLPPCFISDWERGVEISDYNCRFVPFSLHFWFCSLYFEILFIACCPLNGFIPGNSLYSEIYFDINIASPTFLD